MMDEDEHKKLVQLIRKISREVVWEILDEHIEQYEHREKQIKDSELNLHE